MTKPIIITGMFHSGILLVRDVLSHAFFQATGETNVTIDIQEISSFHDTVFERHNWNLFFANPRESFDVDTSDVKRAQETIRTLQKQPAWGWADARTAVLLDMWDEMLPEARYVFAYRHPLDTLYRSLKSNLDPCLFGDMSQAVITWFYYNECLQTFYLKYPERCVFVHADAVADRSREFISLVADKFDLSPVAMDDPGEEQVFEFSPGCVSPEVHSAFSQIFPAAGNFYDRLQEASDLPGTWNFAPDQKQHNQISLLRQWIPADDRGLATRDHLFLQCLLSILDRHTMSQAFNKYRARLDSIRMGFSERDKEFLKLKTELNVQVKKMIDAYEQTETVKSEIIDRKNTNLKLSKATHELIEKLMETISRRDKLIFELSIANQTIQTLENTLNNTIQTFENTIRVLENEIDILIRFIQLLWDTIWVRLGKYYWSKRRKFISRKNTDPTGGSKADTSMLHEYEELEKIFPILKQDTGENEDN